VVDGLCLESIDGVEQRITSDNLRIYFEQRNEQFEKSVRVRCWRPQGFVSQRKIIQMCDMCLGIPGKKKQMAADAGVFVCLPFKIHGICVSQVWGAIRHCN
jgi:hypothetical protein